MQSRSRQRTFAIVIVASLLLVGFGAIAIRILQINKGGKFATDEPAVTYILDTSPRMDSVTREGTRLEVAQGVLAEIVRPSNPELTAGLRVFGSGVVSKACEDTELVVPLEPANQPVIADELLELSVGSSTESALAQSIVAAIRDLEVAAGPHYIVVISGGEDSCSPQAGEFAAAEAARAGIDLQTFIIGFVLSGEQAQALKTMAERMTGGTYYDAPNAAALRAALVDIMSRIERSSQPPAAMIENTAATLPAAQTQTPSSPQSPLELTTTPELVSPTEAISPYSDEELAAQGSHSYAAPESSVDHPCWVARFQASRALRINFRGPNQLDFDPSFEFFAGGVRVPVIVPMSRAEENTWIGSFSTLIEDYNFSVSENIVFEEDGIIWHEFIRDARTGYYSNSVECGPARWTRIP